MEARYYPQDRAYGPPGDEVDQPGAILLCLFG